MSVGPRAGGGGRRLVTRLLLAQGVVLLAAVLTAGLVAAIVGPPLFHDHLVQAGLSPQSPELAHIEQAYTDASAVSLAVALVIALGGAFAVSWYLTRRLQRPLAALTDAAGEMSRGRYDTRVSSAGAGPELDALAATFNSMAGRLETTEDTRRRLLADLAHELRTPIATIGAYLDGLEDGLAAWDSTTARVLRDQTDRLARLAQDIDEVSRAEEGRIPLHRRPTRVGELVGAAVQAGSEGFADKGVRLLTEYGSAGCVVDVDPQRMAQVLGNLLGNALRHTPAGGSVTVASGRTSGYAVLTVTDTGDGIAPESLPHVFERFYRGEHARDRDSGGAGIGLSIVKALVDAHRGTVTASSAGAGRGATFTVTLPLDGASAPS